MKLEFAGAAGGVTGSKHILQVNGKKILLDCGLFQGHRKQSIKLNSEFPFDPAEIDAVVLSHAHIDHSGALPALVKNGFQGPIYCTHATRDLCAIMLRDSAYIQERDAEWIRKKKKDPHAEPLYTIHDADKAISLLRSVAYHQWIPVFPQIKVKFHDSGHILGSATEEWEIFDEDTKQTVKLGFTGDLGRKNLPILKDREQIEGLDFLITESTYGDRLHDEIVDVEKHLAQKINETHDRGGKIIIPSFAVGRTQEILYILKQLLHDGKVPHLPIFVDSPLGFHATEVFKIHPECFDEELLELLETGKDPFCDCEGTQFTQTVEESKAINEFPGPAIIISASGMCEFGRIRHHLANNISDARNTIFIIGFMAQNTLGRDLVEGKSPVNIFGDPYPVKAEVVIYNAFSGHADQKGLLDFASKAGDLKNIFLVHGEPSQQKVLQEKMQKLKNTEPEGVEIPLPGDIYELNVDGTFKKTWEVNEKSREMFETKS